MKEKSISAVVEDFKELEGQKPVIGKSAAELILAIVKKSPKKTFNQKDLREKLVSIEGAATSNPAINGALRKLAEASLITREVQGKHVFYRHLKQ
tara:strand:+ start:359 stop:643 length:285 start_codon:yes stop_codon:yes gene_type:complete